MSHIILMYILFKFCNIRMVHNRNKAEYNIYELFHIERDGRFFPARGPFPNTSPIILLTAIDGLVFRLRVGPDLTNGCVCLIKF